MDVEELRALILPGEDSSWYFKTNITNAESLAAEMAAFANSDGGTLFIGVADDGSISGISSADVSSLNQMISNAASQLVKSPLVVKTSNVICGSGKFVIVLQVPKGMDKPYFDKNGVIWLKIGADKRRVNSKEEMRDCFRFRVSFMPTNCRQMQIGRRSTNCGFGTFFVMYTSSRFQKRNVSNCS